MDLKLADKTALVSGSTKGIGFAIATGLAGEGARVIVNGRSEKAVAEAKQHIVQTKPDAKVEGFAGDLSTAAATETLLQRFPFVDILVNNLGIFEPSPFENISDEDWRRFFEVNVLSGVRLSRAYLPGMRQRGGADRRAANARIDAAGPRAECPKQVVRRGKTPVLSADPSPAGRR